jgi:glycosyltransferase domain-containing protein
MNRSDFLIRLLRYYRDLGFQGCICIGDSSDTEHVERTKTVIAELQGKVNIVYHECSRLNDAETLKHLLDFVSTPYAALVPDDDFLVPAALEQCALFLDRHPDYSAAHGVGAGLRLQSGGAYGEVAWAGHYRQPVIEEANASQRLLNHLGNYAVTLFSVHRIESWRVMYGNVPLVADRAFGAEMLPCCLSAVQGKVKELDSFYLVRQAHGQQYPLPDRFDWITNPNWLPSYQVFRSCLAEELMRQDAISLEEAQEVVKQALWSYLAEHLNGQWRSCYGQPKAGACTRFRQAARSIPGARRVWHTLRSLTPREHDMFSLPALLHPSSPYHTDFMPIYRAITTPPADADLWSTNATDGNL